MNIENNAPVAIVETNAADVAVVATAPAAKPKYLVQREKRERFSFGNTWLNAVLAGFVTDKEKLVAHGVQVKAGTKEELEALSIEAMLPIVQAAIYAEVYVAPTPEAEEVPVAEQEAEAIAELETPAVEVAAEEVAAA